MANLKDLVGRYNSANEKAKKRREAWEKRRKQEELEEAKRLKKLESERFNLLGEVVSQTRFTELYQVEGGMVNFPLLIGIILEGMDQLEKDTRSFDRYLKRYEEFAARQETEATEPVDDGADADEEED